jgi:uncharacterized protein (TIGR02145 family)
MKIIRSCWFCLSIFIGTLIMISNSCKKKEPLTSPILSTVPVTNIAATLASSGGNITSDGGATVTERGVCWSTITGPTTALSTKTTDGPGTGTFTSSITALTARTVYYVKAYATNSVGTNYGNEIIFTTSAPPSTVPGAPTIGMATAGTAKSTITFTAPASNGGSSITGYKVTSSPGGFTSSGSRSPIIVSGLTNGTAYTFTVIAKNANGNSLPSSASNSVIPTAPVTDIDGNVYNTVTIGTQTWMAENLKTTKYNDKTAIPNVTDSTAWINLTTPSYCWYNNDETTYKGTYGALYNWYVVDSASNGGKNVCPKGWHVPTDDEWTILTDYLTNNGYGYGGSGDEIAKSMASQWFWNMGTEIAGSVGYDQASNNSSGFTALPGGFRYSGFAGGPDGLRYSGIGLSYENIGYYGTWWSSSGFLPTFGWWREEGYNWSQVESSASDYQSGYSIRCLKD